MIYSLCVFYTEPIKVSRTLRNQAALFTVTIGVNRTLFFVVPSTSGRVLTHQVSG
jgi:hypothetical protein